MAGKHSENRRDAHDQVEVRDHEVGVVQVQIQRRLRQEQVRKGRRSRTATRSPSANSIAQLNWILPPHKVPSQLNVLIAEGTPMVMVRIENANAEYGLIPLTNMWWPHTQKPRKPIAADGADHRAVTEYRLARERGEQVRRHAHSRKNRDVNLGMAEEPEQVLPQQRRTALVPGDHLIGDHQAAGNEEARARDAIEQQQDARREQNAERQQSRGSP